jgi:hypothetical protein
MPKDKKSKLIKVRLKESVGKHLRLTMPGFSLTIGEGDKDLTDEQLARVQQYVDVVPVKPVPTPTKVTSEEKSVDTSKE